MAQCIFLNIQKKIWVWLFVYLLHLCIVGLFLVILCSGSVSVSKYFPSIEENHAEKIAINREDIFVSSENLIKGLFPGLQLDVYHIGFPSLHLIPITVS